MGQQATIQRPSWLRQVDGETYTMRCPASGEYFELTVKEADKAHYTLILHCITEQMPERTCIPLNHVDSYEGCHRYAAEWVENAGRAFAA
jgi:hypothetical protein